MPLSRCLGLAGGGVVLLLTTLSQAQCAKDMDCKGDRVCEHGKCVAPAVAPPAAAAPVANTPAQPRAAVPAAPAAAAAPPRSVKMRRHSTGMMVGGIVMLSLAPVAFVVAGVARIGEAICNVDHSEAKCDNDYNATVYGSLLTGVALVGVGVPLLVIGSNKEPVDDSEVTASVSPWVTPTAAGVGLRLDM